MPTEDRVMLPKGRSASICAPGFSSMEAMAAAAAASAAHDSGGGTPVSSRRARRPATRSQSARLTGGKSVRRRPQQNAPASETMRSGVSEPRLADQIPTIATPEASPGLRRRGSTRRSVHHQTPPRKSAAFLDVPDAGLGPMEGEDEESYRLRSFSLTSKGNAHASSEIIALSLYATTNNTTKIKKSSPLQ